MGQVRRKVVDSSLTVSSPSPSPPLPHSIDIGGPDSALDIDSDQHCNREKEILTCRQMQPTKNHNISIYLTSILYATYMISALRLS